MALIGLLKIYSSFEYLPLNLKIIRAESIQDFNINACLNTDFLDGFKLYIFLHQRFLLQIWKKGSLFPTNTCILHHATKTLYIYVQNNIVNFKTFYYNLSLSYYIYFYNFKYDHFISIDNDIDAFYNNGNVIVYTYQSIYIHVFLY